MSEPITCLIVDDHEVVREGLRLSLSRSENIRVVGEASDGQAAVTLAKRRKPNVVILDVRMPGMDGWEVLQALRRSDRTRHVPVALSSTDPQHLGWTLAEARGAQAYVMKPFSPADLVRTVRGLVGVEEGRSTHS